MIKAWYLLQEKRKKVQGVHRNDLLWGNNHVRYKGKMLYYKKWIQAGIVYLHDIVIGDRFINIAELSKKINCPTNMFKNTHCWLQFPINGRAKSKRKMFV